MLYGIIFLLILIMENKSNIIRFWEANEAKFAGDILAPEIVRLAKKYIGKKVLDVGAGSGALINLIPGAIGIDIAPKDSKILKEDISQLSFKEESFDTIFATEILEHLDVETLNKGLKEIFRVLKNQGYFIITLPYKEDLKENFTMCPKCGERFHHWGHLHSFDEEKIKNILEKNKFKISKIKILPLSFRAKHSILKHFRWLLERIGSSFKPFNLSLFVVAQKDE